MLDKVDAADIHALTVLLQEKNTPFCISTAFGTLLTARIAQRLCVLPKGYPSVHRCWNDGFRRPLARSAPLEPSVRAGSRLMLCGTKPGANRGIHAEMRNDEFQFSLVSPLFRLRARGPPLLPLLRLQPAQTAKTEPLAMHPESPLRHAFFCVRRLRGRRGSAPCFPALLYVIAYRCNGITSDSCIIQFFTASRNG